MKKYNEADTQTDVVKCNAGKSFVVVVVMGWKVTKPLLRLAYRPILRVCARVAPKDNQPQSLGVCVYRINDNTKREKKRTESLPANENEREGKWSETMCEASAKSSFCMCGVCMC